jgi:phosphoglucomutase
MHYKEIFEHWKTCTFFDEETRYELKKLTDEREIEDRFYCDLEFGTGGLRGLMGAGTNRINRYTIRKVTYGLANYLQAEFGNQAKQKGVAIAFDSRMNSDFFAREVGLVLCATGIKVFLFDQQMPTPILSFTVKHLGCIAGIVITASHNPKEYNGYKVYDSRGCQLVPRYTDQVIRYINEITDLTKIPIADFEQSKAKGLLNFIGIGVLDDFLDAVLKQSCINDPHIKRPLKIVYTPIHGTGNIPVRLILEKDGFVNISVVKSQELPDSDFPTVRSPNPEENGAMELGMQQALDERADIVLGTDPDCDRVGVAVRRGDSITLLNGNQIGALLVHFVLSHRNESLNEKSTLVKTIVTNELGLKIARSYGINVVDTLIGFKYIGDQIRLFEETNEKEFVIGYEESHGYLIGTHAREKDAIVATMLICEMVAYYKSRKKNILDVLEDIYKQYGYYLDKVDSFMFKGRDGEKSMKSIIKNLRRKGTAFITGLKEIIDYSSGINGLPKADVLKYIFHDSSWIAVRPSGTEPKIKVYYSVCHSDIYSAQKRLEFMRSIVGSEIRSSLS